jgi:hypothetical protein
MFRYQKTQTGNRCPFIFDKEQYWPNLKRMIGKEAWVSQRIALSVTDDVHRTGCVNSHFFLTTQTFLSKHMTLKIYVRETLQNMYI